MALSAADQLLVLQDTQRGLEADRLRTEILAAGDDYQASRLDVIDKQLAAVEERLKAAEKQADADEAKNLADFVKANTPTGGWQDGYEHRKKAELLGEFPKRGIVAGPRDTAAVLINRLRAYDLHHTGVASAAGVTPGT